jgi:RNA polymerase sigma-70 factor (ECF subfamily)
MSPEGVSEDWFANVLAGAKRGDPAAFDALVSWLEAPLLGFVRARGVRHVDHVANAALVRAFRGIDGFRGDAGQFRAWVFRISRSLIVDHPGRTSDRGWDPPTPTECPPDPIQPVATEPVERIDAALRSLTPAQRDVLLLRVVAGLSVDESAVAIGRRPRVIGALQHRALTSLRGSANRTQRCADRVPGDEMWWFRPRRDELEAVLGHGLFDLDLVDVAGTVYDLRLAYLPDQHLSRHWALLGFTESRLRERSEPLVAAATGANGSGSRMTRPATREPRRERTRPAIKALTAVTAGVAGKLAFGAAVAAASVGGLHAADVVDVPGLPGNDPPLFVGGDALLDDDTSESDIFEFHIVESGIVEDDVVEDEVPDVAAAAAEKREFSASMRAWSRCIAEPSAARKRAASARDASVAAAAEPCGPRPANPATNRAHPGGRPDDVPGGRPDDVPGGRPDDVPGGRPDDVPGGRPDPTMCRVVGPTMCRVVGPTMCRVVRPRTRRVVRQQTRAADGPRSSGRSRCAAVSDSGVGGLTRRRSRPPNRSRCRPRRPASW